MELTHEAEAVLETSLEYLYQYATALREEGDKGHTEADDNSDFVFAHIQVFKDTFPQVYDYKEEEG